MFKFLSHISSDPTNPKCIIMLHGVGSNEKDLFSLRQYFLDEYSIFSLRGVFDLGGGGYAWYPVDFSTRKPLYDPADLELGYQYIRDCIDHIHDEYHIQYDNIYLMGFSQGAILSYYTLWKSPELLGGIIALSGRIVDEISLDSCDPSRYHSKRVFVGQGTSDQMMPISHLGKIEEYLNKLQVIHSINQYPIGHMISEKEIQDIVQWL